ncbi:unnamed protein product [Plutella xylostella]|uniref:(diamondback moth) hypothetical protein n=1 Tax=Plutella xylostella TaxID=51655 RepID=A0A8S4EN66_PLUXY|nr:unnamed protein product [Plutella xylostella]
MCEQTEIQYLDSEVVWVKLGSCWWPGEVVGAEKLPPDVLPSFRKPPIAVVKFFQEDTFEYVKNINAIYKYNCSRKDEFIKKGLDMFRSKKGNMEKFPEDVVRAEAATGGDEDILSRDEFQETKKESYAGLFGDTPKKTPTAVGKRGKGAKLNTPQVFTSTRKVSKGNSDYKVHILLQGSKTPAPEPAPSTSAPAPTATPADTPAAPAADATPKPISTPLNTTPLASSAAGIYACPACNFSTSRLNVMILHNKSHSHTFSSYTPTPVRKKPAAKPTPKSTPTTSKTPKVRRPKKEKADKEPKKPKGQKRSAEDESGGESKKTKTDEEIKSSLLADWDEESADEADGASPAAQAAESPAAGVAAESPPAAVPADLPRAHVPGESSSCDEKKPDAVEPDAPESDSKYDFCEDEPDWPEEADAGRKIPRVKNPKRKEDTKSLSIDEDDMAKEVAELLSKTTVPELPSAPEPLKVEENFPEPSVVKSPDKQVDVSDEPAKSAEKSPEKPPTIFKTKTFFRSRHSRSQDAIGKYVAEQLNAAAVERMNTDSDINGSEVASSPEARDSPPVESVKVARLAPKIQLKKMKAEYAQLTEKDKINADYISSVLSSIEAEDKNNAPVVASANVISVPSASVSYPPVQEIKNDEVDNQDITESPMVECEEETVRNEAVENNKPELSEVVRSNDSEIERNIDPEVERSDVPKDETCDVPEVESNDVPEVESSEVPEVENSEISEHEKEIISDVTNNEYPEPITCEGVDQDNSQDKQRYEEIEEEQQYSIEEVESYETPTVENNTNPEVNNDVTSNEQPLDNYELKENEQSVVEETISVEEAMERIENEAAKAQPELKTPNLYMNESTASAVDALLSVSREADQMTKNISDDPPEDLFEDDKVDNLIVDSNNIGDSNYIGDSNGIEHNLNNGNVEEEVQEATESQVEEETVITEDTNVPVESYSNGDNQININEFSEQMEIDDSNIATQVITESVVESVPSESDLQVAEALMNLPSTAINSKVVSDVENNAQPISFESQEPEHEVTSGDSLLKVNSKYETPMETDQMLVPQPETDVSEEIQTSVEEVVEDVQPRYETDQEKCENLFAAQSLVQMSEAFDRKMKNASETKVTIGGKIITTKTDKPCVSIDTQNTIEEKVAMLSEANKSDANTNKTTKFETTSSKLLKMLEEPCGPKVISNKLITTKQIVSVQNKEKILNLDVALSPLKSKPQQSPKQKIIIRRTAPAKTIINNFSEANRAEKIVLSRSNKPTVDGKSVQTYTIQATADTPTDGNTIIIQQQKLRKVNTPPKLQKIKPQTSLVAITSESKPVVQATSTEDALFDINSMPIVLSDDILTPENIEKMPMVMSDGNIVAQPAPARVQTPVKTKVTVAEPEKKIITMPAKKPEIKTIVMNPSSSLANEGKQGTTPNILSKSSKMRGPKPMLVIDKATGKQKIIMTKAEPTKAIKEISQTSKVQSVGQAAGKTEKFILLPSSGAARQGRTQKIVIDPHSGKAHVLVAKSSEPPADTKPVSAKLLPAAPDAAPGGTVMIITNAQGTQSRIVLTPEHEKLLFPNKQQNTTNKQPANMTQLKAITQRVTQTTTAVQKTQIVTNVQKTVAAPKPQTIVSAVTHAPAKTTRIVAKQKPTNAIITSKGQLIVGGRQLTPTPLAAAKRLVAEHKKPVQKAGAEPLIFLQQKNGTVMQLTAAQFEHLQRTGQIVQKSPAPTPAAPAAPAPAPRDNKLLVQKSVTITSNEQVLPLMQKQKMRALRPAGSPAPAKKMKKEVLIAPAKEIVLTPAPAPAIPPLAPISSQPPTQLVVTPAPAAYSELQNIEELLPSTAISRAPPAPAPAPAPEPAPAEPAALADGQLLAVPGEHFGALPGSFYLCVEENGQFTPIDNRPLVLENNQLVPMPEPAPERRDILEAALANSDVFHEPPRDDAPAFRELNAAVSGHCRVSETSTTLHQPIMTPAELPSHAEELAAPASLEAGLAVIGVTPPAVPTTLELPITVTDPRIAPRAAPALGGPYAPPDLYAEEEAAAPISMPLLTDEDEGARSMPSMPILTDDLMERTTASSADSPASLDARDDDDWSRRLRTPGSDASADSAEIPLQPHIQISGAEITHTS